MLDQNWLRSIKPYMYIKVHIHMYIIRRPLFRGCHQAAKEQCSSYTTFYVMTIYFPSRIADCLMLTGIQYGQKVTNHLNFARHLDPWISVKQCFRLDGNAIQPCLASAGQSGTQAKPLASPRASNMRSKANPQQPKRTSKGMPWNLQWDTNG